MAELRRASGLRQAELTDAALHIIATRGIAALSTRALAEQVGLTTGAIFRHFSSLDALLEAVVARVEAELAATYPPAALPPLERLERFIELRSAAVGKQLGILRLVLSEQFLLALPKRGSTRLSACMRRSRAYVTESVREGQRQGVVRADLPAEHLGAIVIGTVQMVALSGGGRQRAERANEIRSSLLALLRPPARRRRRPGAPGRSAR